MVYASLCSIPSRHFGRIDSIIQSEIKAWAGIILEDEPNQDLDEQVNINIRGLMLTNRAP